MLIGLPHLLIFSHLLVKLLLVPEVRVSAIGHHFSLLLLLLFLSLDNFDEIVPILLLDLLHS